MCRCGEVMTTLSRILGLAFLASLLMAVAIVVTDGRPVTLLGDLSDLYHRITS